MQSIKNKLNKKIKECEADYLIEMDYFYFGKEKGLEESLELLEKINTGDISDGFYTFRELYNFRMQYNAGLFNIISKLMKSSCDFGAFKLYKSYKHSDGEWCFGEKMKWFIVMLVFPDGRQISNHYRIKHWDLFNIPEVDIPEDKFDGHTPQDVLDRLNELNTKYLK